MQLSYLERHILERLNSLAGKRQGVGLSLSEDEQEKRESLATRLDEFPPGPSEPLTGPEYAELELLGNMVREGKVLVTQQAKRLNALNFQHVLNYQERREAKQSAREARLASDLELSAIQASRAPELEVV